MKILIAEDRDEDRYLLETILKSADYQVTAVANGQEAWDRCRAEAFDLVISDILMPEMDGYMLCRRFRREPSLSNTPFIFLTATYMSRSDESFAMQVGADAFIKKPVDPDHILQVVAQYAGKPAGAVSSAAPPATDCDFTEQHSRRILSVLRKKSNELEGLVRSLEKTQRALKASEERYRLISASTSDYVYALILNEEGRVVIDWVSGAFQRITGFDSDDIRSIDDWIAKVVPEDRHWLKDATGPKFSEEIQEIEYRITTAAGDIIWLKDTSSPMLDVSKESVGRVGAVQDITRAKNDEIRMKRLATAVESAAESILITDAQGRIEYVNPAFETITGYSTDEVMGENPRFLQSGKHGKQFFHHMWQTLGEGKIWKGHITNKKKNGTLYEIEAVISPIFDGGDKITHFIAVRRDVTREKALEAQLRQTQKMEAMGTLAGGIAHDFNNILSAIIGFSELSIDGTDVGSEMRNNINQILRAGNRARDLVKQILTFARQSEHEAKPVKFAWIIKEALKMLRASLPATIEIKHDIGSQALVMGDASELHQVVMNLCTNASQAMEPHRGQLVVTLHDVTVDGVSAGLEEKLSAGAYQKLMVSDTGVGMTRSQQERIFEPFYTTKEKGEGTGLGLAVVHGIVESHGGAIKVYSEPGSGSSFTVFLPVLERVEASVPKRASTPLATRDEHVLFLDDEPSIVQLAAQILTALGYRVTACTSGSDALAKFEASPEAFDIVISDMTMPEMTGDMVARRIMAIRPHIPVILCSGFTKQIDEADAQALGIRALLTKPLFKNELATAVRAALDDHGH